MSHLCYEKPYSSNRTDSGRTLEKSKWKLLNASMDEEEVYDVDSEPLLLVSFKKYHNSKIKMKIVDETLQHILKPVGSLPLSIVNITGPANLGKSFLINFILRKLEAMQNKERNWMGWGHHKLKLKGFPLRNAKHIGLTKEGISVWPRPFIIDTPEGKTAVLVMETNGLHDQGFDSAEALTSIFCLCFLMSSILIYNTSEDNISEDSFMPWIPYIRYGKTIIKNAEPCHETPFQKLSVLVRDWRKPGEYCYGDTQGKSFLSKQLQEHLDYKNGRHFGKALKEHFLKAECSLLPPIDDAVTADSLNSGRRLNHKFAKILEQYVNGLFSVENLYTKRICGTEINSAMFGKYIHAYVNLFNAFNKGKATINGDTLFNISKSTLNACTVDDALATYNFVMENELKIANYVTNTALQKIHKIAKHDAEQFFKKAFLRKNSNDLVECRESLSKRVAEAFKIFRRRNEKFRKDILSGGLDELLAECSDSLYQQTLVNDDASSCDKNLKSATNEKLAEIKRQLYVDFPRENDESIGELLGILHKETSQMLEILPEKKTIAKRIQNIKNTQLGPGYECHLKTLLVKNP